MSALLEKQEKTLDFHSYPFDTEIFRKTFNGYIRKFNTIFAVVVLLVCAPFIVYGIARYLEMTKVDITHFLELWHAGESFLQYAGFSHVVFGMFASGIIAVGHFAFGIIAVGNFAFGVISVGGFLSCGVLSIGGYSSVGVGAVAYSKSYGIIAVSTGYQQFIGAAAFSGGQALGVCSNRATCTRGLRVEL